MSKDLNITTIIGRLTRDPETKYTPSGTAIAKFAIASSESYKKNEQWVEYANFFDITVWGNQAVCCEKYLKKGSQVCISGSLRQNRWTDQNGQNRSKVEINASSVQFLNHANNQQQGQPQTQQQNNNQGQYKPPANNQPQSQIVEDPWGIPNNSGNDSDIPF